MSNYISYLDKKRHLILYCKTLSCLKISNVILLMNAELQNIMRLNYVYIKLCLLHVQDYEQAKFDEQNLPVENFIIAIKRVVPKIIA